MHETDDTETVIQGTWVRKFGYVSEFDIDVRWVLYYPNNQKPQGSLRIVSHPDLPPGHLKYFVSIVIKRYPKNKNEIIQTIKEYGITNEELEAYTLDEHVQTWDNENVDKIQNLEKLFKIKIFNE